MISLSAPGLPASCPRCRCASSAPRQFGCVAAGVGKPVVYGPSLSGGRCSCPGPVSSRPVWGGGALRGLPPPPCSGRWPAAGPLGCASAACCPPGSGLAADPGREAADELEAPSAAWWGSVWGAAWYARSAGGGMVDMCARSLQGLLDRRRRSVADDVRWALGSLGPPWPLSMPSWRTTRRAAGGGVLLRLRERPGFLVSWCCSGHPWGVRADSVPPRGERLGGLLYVPVGEPKPGGGPWWCPGDLYGAACLRGSGTSCNVVAGGLGRVPGSLGTQGWLRCCAFALLYGCAGPRVGAIASAGSSFRPGRRAQYAP